MKEEIRLPAVINNMDVLLGFVIDRAHSVGISEQKIKQLELAVEEVLVNIFKYAYPDKVGDIELRCYMRDQNTFTVEVLDSGVYFDPLSSDTPKIDTELEERPVGGLGIFFVKQMMDEVKYRRLNDRNCLTMSVNLP